MLISGIYPPFLSGFTLALILMADESANKCNIIASTNYELFTVILYYSLAIFAEIFRTAYLLYDLIKKKAPERLQWNTQCLIYQAMGIISTFILLFSLQGIFHKDCSIIQASLNSPNAFLTAFFTFITVTYIKQIWDERGCPQSSESHHKKRGKHSKNN